MLCTRVAAAEGRCDGRIIGENCKGAQKVQALIAYLGQDELPCGSHAYGDSESDMPLLKAVDNGFLVRGNEIVPVASEGKGSDVFGGAGHAGPPPSTTSSFAPTSCS